MENKDYSAKIRARVKEASDGRVFVMLDFADVAPNNVANRIVSRLQAEGLLRPIMRGIYQKPRKSEFLGEFVEPSVDEVAHALSRKNGWTICPDGDTALNLLGLSTQVPSNWHYLSDGPYKSYRHGNGMIVFTHTANRMMRQLSEKSALVVQALKALGGCQADRQTTARIAERFSPEELSDMEKETRNVTDWIHSKIASMMEARDA